MSAPLPAKIDPDKDWFIANGRKYYIQDFITMGRYRDYKRLLHILVFGASPQDHVKFLDFVIQQMSGPVTFLATHKILENAFNAKNAMTDFIEEKPEPWFLFGTLFINREGENIATWDEKVVRSKIDDWMKEGIDVDSFFFICARQEPLLRAKYLKSHPGLKAAASPDAG